MVTRTDGNIHIFSPAEHKAEDIDRILQAFPDTAFLWIENPDDGFHSLRLHGICGRLQDDRLTVRRTFGFIFGEYYLNIRQGCVIKPNADGQSFSLDGYVSFNHSGCTLDALDVSIGADGQFSFHTVPIEDEDIFRKLGAGIRYAAANNDETCEETVDIIHNTVLRPKSTFTFMAYIDPLHIKDGSKSYLGLPADTEFISSFISVSGRELTLRTRGDSSLVFQLAAYYIHDETVLETTLLGSFDILENEPLLCGLSGTEYFNNPNAGAAISFSTYAGFVDSENTLTKQCETSYISLSDSTVYYSQPQTAPFFAPAGAGLRFLPMPQYQMEADPVYVPMMPYNNALSVFDTGMQSTQFETTLLKTRHAKFGVKESPSRFNLLSAAAAPSAISTQGLCIWLSGDEWESIGFAKLENGSYLRFVNIGAAMRQEYQQSELFIMYGRDKPLPNNAADDDFELTLEGFHFALQPKHWRNEGTDTDTVMIIKYRIDKSIAELADDSVVLKASIAACYNEDQMCRSEFEDFLQIIEDKDFQGVLFLNPRVTITNAVSSEMRPMLNSLGDDINNLYAHNVVFPRNKAQVINGSIEIDESLFAATIDYKSKTHLSFDPNTQNPPEADFKTISLLVDIADSKLKIVQSESELLLNKFFGSTARKTSDGGNCLIIDGRLAAQGKLKLFKYTLRSGGIYDLSGKLQHISVTDVSLTSDAAGEPRFTLNGRLYFTRSDGGDLFCYGLSTDSGFEAGGLEYNNIIIHKQGQFRLDYAGLYYDPLASAARENSMTARFPYYLESFTSFEKTGDKTPAAEGYIAIQSPEQQSALAQEWYGMRWRIPLGSLGDLSSGSSLDIYILTAWSPESGCFIGVKLPFGANGLDVQGILKLGFKAIEIKAETKEITNEEKRTDFSMILTQFSVSLLSLSFPPGNQDFYHRKRRRQQTRLVRGV